MVMKMALSGITMTRLPTSSTVREILVSSAVSDLPVPADPKVEPPSMTSRAWVMVR